MRADGYVDAVEAAAIAGVARATVYGWVRRGIIIEADLVREVASGAVWLRRTAVAALVTTPVEGGAAT